MAEPTSTLTFGDLILHVAEKLGLAYYGAAGTNAAAIPVNVHDLEKCKRIVNNALRMFVSNGPKPNGWRWLRPVLQTDLWGDVAIDSSNLISSATYNVSASNTTIVVPQAAFFASMELKTMAITSVGNRIIQSYVSPTSVVVSGTSGASLGKSFSIESNGNFTLPVSFSGQYLGGLSYVAGTNKGIGTDWADESTIRKWRADVEEETGTPYMFAVRIMDTGTPRRRWELMAFSKPDEDLSVEFPAMLGFDSLVNLTDVPPSPFSHDETIKAACEAQCEKDEEEALGVSWQYYSDVAMPNSFQIDAMSAPKTLGYFWNPTSTDGRVRPWHGPRPNVTFNP